MTGPVFVLSAGRTGTVFLSEHLPERVPSLACVHEPPGSRANLMLANLRNLTGVGEALLRRRFLQGLAERRARVPAGRRYVEINPMLCPLTDEVAELPEPVTVIHVVREPASWVRSIRAFRASGWRRHVIDHLPLGTPFPAPRPPGWTTTDQVTRALWRWRYCNEQILALEGRVARYARIRHEDLFADEVAVRRATLEALLAALDVPWTEAVEPLLALPPANPAPPATPVVVDPAAVEAICGPLLDVLGYRRRQAVSENSGVSGGSDTRSSRA